MKAKQWGVAMAVAILSQNALAQNAEQRIRVEVEPLENSSYQANVYYSTSDQSLTTGLGLRMHYASGVIGNLGHSDIVADPVGVQIQAEASTDFDDNDANTDSVLHISWASLDASFPADNITETLLYRVTFDLLNANTSLPVILNFTGYTANGYTFVANNFSAQLPDTGNESAPTPTPVPTPAPVEVSEQLDELNEDLDVIESIQIEEGQPVSDDVVNQVGSALEKTSNLAQQVTQSLPEGTAGVDVALSALDTMSRTLSASANVSSKGGAVSNTAATNSINNVATVLTSLATRTADITPQQRATVQTLASNTVTNSSSLIRAGASNDDLVSMVAATSAVINAASDAGGELTTELVSQAEALVTKAVKTGMSSFAPGIDVEDPVQVENLLRTNPEALAFAIEASVAVKSRIKPDSTAVEQELASRGLASAASESFTSVLSAVSNPDGINVGGSSASEVLLSALVQFLTGGAQSLITEDGRQVFALSAGNVDLTIDPLTGTVRITAPGEAYSAAIVNTRIVSASMPDGLSFMRDGRALIVSNGVAMELAPIASDLIGFTGAVEQAGYALTLRDRGRLDIRLSDTQRFTGVFAFDNLASSSGTCGATTITEPSGEINAPSYAFGVVCTNGTEQTIVPFVHDTAFYRSVAGYGLRMTTDRNTGIVNIPDIGAFKPGFFVSALNSEDVNFWQANKDARGVAFRFVDLNGNGQQDVIFYTAAGTQALYRVSQ